MRAFDTFEGLACLPSPLVIAAGVFDGVHPGHRAVLRSALDAAAFVGGTAAALTFDPHPSKILRPENAARILTSTRHKLRLIEGAGIGAVLVIPFTQEFASWEAETFVERLCARVPGLARICVGKGWKFGHDRRGDCELLRRLGPEYGFETTEVEPVFLDGRMVSSSMIRGFVESGDLQNAQHFLGRPYAVLGTVVRGDGLGRQLGFPTANLAAHNEQFPPDGVYAVLARFGSSSLTGLANIGSRPTVKAAGDRILEVHLPGFSGDLYGQDIETEFLHFLRPEKKFPDLEALRAQIAADIEAARALHEVR